MQHKNFLWLGLIIFAVIVSGCGITTQSEDVDATEEALNLETPTITPLSTFPTATTVPLNVPLQSTEANTASQQNTSQQNASQPNVESNTNNSVSSNTSESQPESQQQALPPPQQDTVAEAIDTSNQAPANNTTSSQSADTFDIQPRDGLPGEAVTITWNFPNSQEVSWLGDGIEPRSVLPIASNQPSSGSYDFILPSGTDFYTDFVNIYPRVTYTDGTSNDFDAIHVSINCPFTKLDPTATHCPKSEVTPSITYQEFEHGWMLQRGDTSEIYVFADNGFIVHPAPPTETLPDDSSLAPPSNEVFANLWYQHDTFEGGDILYNLLGSAVGTSSSYTATIQESPYIRSGGTLVMTFPDGGIIRITNSFMRLTAWQRI